MSNIEENAPVAEKVVTEQKTTQGLAQERRKLRERRNAVNYQLLDNGDSSYNSEDFISEHYMSEEYEEEQIGGRKKSSKSKPKHNKPTARPQEAIEPEGDDGNDTIDEGEDDLSNIINLSELKGTEIKNSKLLLALIEICINSKKYGINLANKSRIFWDEVYHIADFEDIFKSFKGETLRKYWRIISDIGKMGKVVRTIKKYENQIDDPNAK